MALKYIGPGDDPGCSCHIAPPCARCVEYVAEVDESEENDMEEETKWELAIMGKNATLFVEQVRRERGTGEYAGSSLIGLDLTLDQAYELQTALANTVEILERLQTFPLAQKVGKK